MHVLTLVFGTGLAALFIVLGFNLLITLIKNKQDHHHGASAVAMQDIERRLSAIEERLANVETIATSREFQLERKFSELEEESSFSSRSHS